MTEQLILFETAVLAKEKGFDEPTKFIYNPFRKLMPEQATAQRNSGINISGYVFIHACTQSLLQKWLREKHNIHTRITDVDGANGVVYHAMYLQYFTDKPLEYTIIPFDENVNIKGLTIPKIFDTYEEALELALQEGLKLINTEKS